MSLSGLRLPWHMKQKTNTYLEARVTDPRSKLRYIGNARADLEVSAPNERGFPYPAFAFV